MGLQGSAHMWAQKAKLSASLEAEESPGALVKNEVFWASLANILVCRVWGGIRECVLNKCQAILLQVCSSGCHLCRTPAQWFSKATSYIFFQLVRKMLKDLWVCPQSADFGTASTDRLIILDLTQWDYKLFIPSWKKELDSTSGGWTQ